MLVTSSVMTIGESFDFPVTSLLFIDVIGTSTSNARLRFAVLGNCPTAAKGLHLAQKTSSSAEFRGVKIEPQPKRMHIRILWGRDHLCWCGDRRVREDKFALGVEVHWDGR